MQGTSIPELPNGIRHLPSFLDQQAQERLLEEVRAAVRVAPLFTPAMPRTGKPMSVRMTNCGALGWVTDKERGYRYQPTHPVTGEPWPPIPPQLLALWQEVADCGLPPEACLVNFYTAEARMGLHQDRDEAEFSAPVVSVSLGDTCLQDRRHVAHRSDVVVQAAQRRRRGARRRGPPRLPWRRPHLSGDIDIARQWRPHQPDIETGDRRRMKHHPIGDPVFHRSGIHRLSRRHVFAGGRGRTMHDPDRPAGSQP